MSGDLAVCRRRAWDLVVARKAADGGAQDAKSAYAAALRRAARRVPEFAEGEQISPDRLDEEHLTADRVVDHLTLIAVSAITCLAGARRQTYHDASDEVMGEVQMRENALVLRQLAGGDA